MWSSVGKDMSVSEDLLGASNALPSSCVGLAATRGASSVAIRRRAGEVMMDIRTFETGRDKFNYRESPGSCTVLVPGIKRWPC